ncbi:hypothetical protein ATR1_067d0294 [Acetobacter tropicalis]|uniref:Uncharacterized protein n=1 Tax=Acetobacter tropicalis TaxID=104102 RepID=A0A511FMC3_9PROT|nr:hypothetical protein ATR1_067d0294 [Acetobacter tropicalis]GEL49944.1 hypothetical protein ATR01nite_10190 [Acetobacter tropicalis]
MAVLEVGVRGVFGAGGRARGAAPDWAKGLWGRRLILPVAHSGAGMPITRRLAIKQARNAVFFMTSYPCKGTVRNGVICFRNSG